MAAYLDNDDGRRWRAWHIAAWATAAALLSLPLVAMQFTDAVDWTGSDFLVMGVVLFACCAVFHLGTRRARDFAQLAAVAIAVGTAFLLTWINLAVGIIGGGDAPANLMYFGVIAIAIVGSLFVGSDPRALAGAMLATAIAQGVVAVVVAIASLGDWRSLALSAFFVVPWLAAAALFARTARAART